MVNFSEPDKNALEAEFITTLLEYGIPIHLHGGLARYVFEGVPTGHFLNAVLTNDLYEAVNRADDSNQRAIAALAKFLFNNVPASCFGTDEKVTTWCKHHGWWGLRTGV